MTISPRADLYALMAELLAEPPHWIALPGRMWPVFETVAALRLEWEAARRYLDRLAMLPAEEPDRRLERYAALFAAGKPRFWLYESAARTGKILGDVTFEMARLYRSFGLEVKGAELPDHISLELAFLSHLAAQTEALPYEKQFLEAHGDWMVDLGRALQNSGDEVYAVIGALLADWLTFSICPTPLGVVERRVVKALPTIPNPDNCTLCGFCAQVCPPRALKVLEDHQETILTLNAAKCIGCGKCERICDFKALKMLPPYERRESGGESILRRSPVVHCEKCGIPIASRAELDYIVFQIGEAAWQYLCLDCRAGLYV